MQCCDVLCCGLLFCAVLCNTVLCCAVLCSAVLCSAVLHRSANMTASDLSRLFILQMAGDGRTFIVSIVSIIEYVAVNLAQWLTYSCSGV